MLQRVILLKWYCYEFKFSTRIWTVIHHDWRHTDSGNNCIVTVDEIEACNKCGAIWSTTRISRYHQGYHIL